MQKSRFQEEFPELAAGADDKSQAASLKREEDGKELQYGPGPSLRPQSKWDYGYGQSILCAWLNIYL